MNSVLTNLKDDEYCSKIGISMYGGDGYSLSRWWWTETLRVSVTRSTRRSLTGVSSRSRRGIVVVFLFQEGGTGARMGL